MPAELFTREFWWDLTMSMKTDGVLVVVSRMVAFHNGSTVPLSLPEDAFSANRTLQGSSRVEHHRRSLLRCLTCFRNVVHSRMSMAFLITRPAKS